jgi:amino-acid N-acetyltransferase
MAMTQSVTIRRAEAADYPRITRLLTEAALPLDGLNGHENFLVLCQDGKTIGCAALERYGRCALLRSVALEAPARGQGLGRRLVQQALQQARRDGVAEIILLTTTAARFFERLGFVPISREDVPEPVRVSAEFRGACPDTAAVLRLALN